MAKSTKKTDAQKAVARAKSNANLRPKTWGDARKDAVQKDSEFQAWNNKGAADLDEEMERLRKLKPGESGGNPNFIKAEKRAATKNGRTLKRKPHERKMCGFRVSNAEHAQIALALRKLNAEAHKRGGMVVEFSASDLLRGAVLALVGEMLDSEPNTPDWPGILGDVRKVM